MRNLIMRLMTVFSLLLLFFVSGCSDSEVPTDGNQPVSDSYNLVRITSNQELEAILKQGMENRSGAIETTGTGIALPPSAMGNDGAGSFSSTNLQVAGVDEADVVKNNGSYIFHAVSGGYNPSSIEPTPPRLRVLQMLSGSERTEKVAEIETGSIGDPAVDGLYLAADRPDQAPDLLIALSGKSPNWQEMWFDSSVYWSSGRTAVSFYNVNNPVGPVSVADIELDGTLISSRRIGETLYLVTRYQPPLNIMEYPTGPVPLPAGLTTETATLPALLPGLSVNHGTSRPLVQATDCYAIPTFKDNPNYGDIITITAIDLATPDQPVSQCMVGATETIFVSTNALYLATSRYRYVDVPTIQPAIAASLQYPDTVHTDIHKFGLTGTTVSYRGSGSVPGHLGWEQDKKPFRFGEVGDALGVVTSIGETWDNTATTRLTLLSDGNDNGTAPLATIAELPNEGRPEQIGKPGEKLYAARFLGNRLYLVTFRVTDPLYAIDLSDPSDPAIIGELSIPGYSDYLHPISDGLLLGIGKDAWADNDGGDGRGAWYQGVKISLFDVSQPDQPSELQSVVIGERGSDSAVLRDHHAFSFLRPDPAGPMIRFALPVKRHEGPPAYGDPNDPWTFYEWTDTGLHLFEIDTTPDSPSLSSSGAIVTESAADGDIPYYSTWDDRSVLTDTGVHYVHAGQIWSADWQNWANVSGPQ